jgi:hypothetical protein
MSVEAYPRLVAVPGCRHVTVIDRFDFVHLLPYRGIYVRQLGPRRIEMPLVMLLWV